MALSMNTAHFDVSQILLSIRGTNLMFTFSCCWWQWENY